MSRQEYGPCPYRAAYVGALHRLEKLARQIATPVRVTPNQSQFRVSSKNDPTNPSLRPGAAINSANTAGQLLLEIRD
jgi:hypothetical protein